jgi:hypothetical protein
MNKTQLSQLELASLQLQIKRLEQIKTILKKTYNTCFQLNPKPKTMLVDMQLGISYVDDLLEPLQNLLNQQ